MAQSIKLGLDTYLDSSGVYCGYYGKKLSSMYLPHFVVTDTIPDFAIPGNGYYDVSYYVSAVLPTDITTPMIISLTADYWLESNGAWSPVVFGNSGAYIVGTPGVSVRGLKLRVWYV